MANKITDEELNPNTANSWGLVANAIRGGSTPMGSATGLHPMLGAPIVGALAGAGLGGIYGGVRSLLEDEDQPPKPWWKKPWLIGTAGGLGLGLASGLTQTLGNQPPKTFDQLTPTEKKGYASPNNVIRVIMNDPSITQYEKTRLVNLVEAASPSQTKQLLAMAVAGTLTAAAAHTVMRTGFFGSTIAGGVAAALTRNLMRDN